MAVQAAIMNPHFIHFCFPGSAMEYEMGAPYSPRLGGEEAAAEELGVMAGEGRQTPSALLSFMDSASSNIKLALGKPGKSKRKVNHRKYLQKQIKRCNGLIRAAGGGGQHTAGEGGSKRQTPSPSSSSSSSSSSSISHSISHSHSPAAAAAGPFQCRPPPRRDGSQSNLQSRSLAALFDSVQELRPGPGAGGRKVPLRNRNLPPSFFTEPVTPTPGPGGLTLGDLERGHPEFFELLGPDYSGLAPGPETAFLPSAEHQPQYQAYQRGAGLSHYPEAWLPCHPLKKSPPPPCQLSLSERGVRTVCYPGGQASPSPPPPATVGDTAGSLTPFPHFFPECSLPQVSYDYNSPGYTCSRQHFPNL